VVKKKSEAGDEKEKEEKKGERIKGITRRRRRL
jgi:hypothetical protein